MLSVCATLLMAGCLAAPGPLVVGHRGTGSSGPLSENPFPENTLPSIRQGFREGADIVEVDVRLDRDGIPILWHDETVKIDGRKIPVREVSYRQMPPVEGAGGMRAPVPTLCAALRLALCMGCCHKVLLIELKTEDECCDKCRLVSAVLHVLRCHDAVQRVIIGASETEALRMVERMQPGITTGFFARLPRQAWPTVWEMLGPEPTPIDWIFLRQRFGMTPFSQARILRRAGDKRIGVGVWTVDHPLLLRFFDFRGFDMLITNEPDVASRVRYGSQD